MSRTDTWMPLYIGDYLADTMTLDTLEHGAYLLLIMHYWRNGPIQDDDRALAGIARMDRKVWAEETGPVIREFFDVREGRLHHKRIDLERERAGGISNKRATAGRNGAQSKWANSGDNPARTRSERLAEARKLGRHTNAEWTLLLAACGSACVRCGDGGRPLVRDHIKPIYQGGSDGIENIQPLCGSCNSSKGSEDVDHRPNDWQMTVKTPDERLAKRLTDACVMPGPSQSHLQKSKKEDSVLRTDATASGLFPIDARQVLWSEGLAQLRQLTGQGEGKARALLGKLCKEAGDDCSAVSRALGEATSLRPGDPVGWLTKAVKAVQTPRNGFIASIHNEGIGNPRQAPTDPVTLFLEQYDVR